MFVAIQLINNHSNVVHLIIVLTVQSDTSNFPR